MANPEPTPTKPAAVAEVGDLVVVRKVGARGWPLRVARVLRCPPKGKRGPRTFLLHWYGNYMGSPVGSHTPGWKDNQQTWYFKKEPNRPEHQALTSDETRETIQVQDICPYAIGFSLTPRSKIPGDILELVAEDPDSAFQMPKN